MELNELLAKHIAGLKKEAVASGWAEAWRNTGDKSYTDETVRTTLSRALKGEVPAVRFFFGQPERAQLLARQLQLTDDQDNELRQAAKRHLERDGKQPTRTVLEMAPFGDLQPAIWHTLIDRLLEAKDAGPFELVVTELQDHKLPRLWDGYPDLIRLRRVADAKQSRAAVLEAAGDEAVILSARRYPPYERWGAMNASHRGITFEPEDALARIGADGALDAPPVPAHPLAEQSPALHDGGVAAQMQHLAAAEVRRLAFALSTETTTDNRSPDSRARMAAALGIRAAQTTEERLGQKLVKVDTQELERLLRRAERVATPAMALLVDNKQVVLLNPDPAMAAVVEGTSAKLHHVEVKQTALYFLLAAAAGLTTEDAVDDPLLLGLVADVAKEHGQSYALHHARASLLFSGAIRPALPPQAERPDEVLRTLTTIVMPVPTVYLPTLKDNRNNRHDGDILIAFRNKVDERALADLKDMLDGITWPEFEKPDSSGWSRPTIVTANDFFHTAPPLATGLLRPDARAAAWLNGKTAISVTIPGSAEQARDAAAWGDTLDAGMKEQQMGAWTWMEHHQPEAEVVDAAKVAFLALRRALLSEQPMPLTDGRRLLPLAGPFAAELDVRVCAREMPTAVSVVGRSKIDMETVLIDDGSNDGEQEQKKYSLRIDWHTEHAAGRITKSGDTFVRTISGLRIRHGRHVVHVRFIYSPLLAGMGR